MPAQPRRPEPHSHSHGPRCRRGSRPRRRGTPRCRTGGTSSALRRARGSGRPAPCPGSGAARPGRHRSARPARPRGPRPGPRRPVPPRPGQRRSASPWWTGHRCPARAGRSPSPSFGPPAAPFPTRSARAPGAAGPRWAGRGSATAPRVRLPPTPACRPPRPWRRPSGRQAPATGRRAGSPSGRCPGRTVAQASS